ncbi:hypothetical protein ACFPT7_07645 [Acidicapsa dinghuensis]|uniref:Proteasome subunit beta n=1 Tax=Acidicapsa dinghuensis TaxID=2218256 RepID=A0ABW1ED08_9BACT|nr:hypothetical protein [Acidicapsa dinghuensis]
MTVIVACRAASGIIVFGADRQITADDQIRYGTKLSFHAFQNGRALIGMAARDVNVGFQRKVELFRAMRHVSLDQDPVEVIQRRMTNTGESTDAEVQLLCAVASRTVKSPRLLGISDKEVFDFSERKFCCIGSGDGAALAILKQADQRLQTLRDVQVAVCASVWIAKESDPLCGGPTDIWWLTSDLGEEKLGCECIRNWEDYFKSSFPNVLARWLEGAQ